MENLVSAVGHGRTNHAYVRRAIRIAISLVAAAATFIVVTPGAQAAQTFPQLSKFCPSGTAEGQCAQASGLATSPVDGHIFEVDTRNNRVQEFTPWGEFVKAFGWSVVASGPGNKPRNEIQQLAVTATGGNFKLRYGTPSGPGAFTAVETTSIPFQASSEPSAAQIQNALVTAPFAGLDDPFVPGDLNVSGPAGGPWAIEFTGRYADSDFGGGSFVLETKAEGLTGAGAGATLTVTQPGGNYEICVPADGDVCRDGSPGTHPGQLGGSPGSNVGAQGVAIDSSGDIFVLDRRNHRIQKYDSDGTFLRMFGGGVNATTGEDICTAAQVEGGDHCGAGTVGNPGPGEGEFGPWQVNGLPNLGDYLAIGPDDTVFVGDTGRIQRFDPEGSFQGQFSGAVSGEIVQSLAVGPDGSIYASFADASAPAAQNSKPNIRRLDASGSETAQIPATNPRGIAIDSGGNAFVLTFDLGTETSTVRGFSSADVPIDLEPNGPGTTIGQGALQNSTSIAVASPPTCGLTTTNLVIGSYLINGAANSIFLYGGAPDPAVCPQPPVPPTIDAQFASRVDPTSASLRARINPRFWPDTRYFVEYGTGKCSDGGCNLLEPALPGSLLTTAVLNTEVLTKAILIEGLQSGTTYHFRFVSQSGGGGPVVGPEQIFRTTRAPGEESGCPNDRFRVGQSATLPDCRAYELVSPLDKSNGDVSLSAEWSVAQAAANGDRMTFSSLRSFGDAEGAPLVSQYLSQRDSNGWTTESISPPRSVPSLYPLGAATESNFTKALSEDLCSGWVLQDNEKLLANGAPEGAPNLYRRDNCGDGGYELITSTLPPGVGPVPLSTVYYPTVQGFSNDASRTVFRANAALAVAAGSPRPPFVCATVGNTPGTVSYRWLRDGVQIGGATQPTYTYVTADVGKTIQCQVTTTMAGRTSLVVSETLLVAPAAGSPPNPGFKQPGSPDLPGAPTLAGAQKVGATLTCQPGPWNGSPTFSYQWLRNGTAIGGATDSTYVPAASDQGTTIQCRLSGMNDKGASISFSRSVTIAADLPLATAPPVLDGSPAAGETLTCEEGAWQGAPTSISYQWLRNGAVIGGASSSAYALIAADEGKAIQCRIVAVNSEATVAATSSRIVVAPPPGVAPPSRLIAGEIGGTPETGETLTCEPGSWQGSPTFAYQWLRNGSAIGGASTNEYMLTAADQGKAIQCEVTASNAGGAVVALDASPSNAIYAAPPAAPRTVVSTTRSNFQLYISSGGILRLVSVMPNGIATTASATAGTAWSLAAVAPNSREDLVSGAVSDDGTRVFWTATPFETFEDSGIGAGSLYLRLNATEPQSAISGGKCTEAGKGCTIPVSASSTARFVAADPTGARVVYMTGNADPATGLQLFTADVDTAGGEPAVNSELIAEGVRGVVGVSQDAGRIYFVSRQVLTSDTNSEGAGAASGQPNLYFYDEEAPLEFVATLSALDAAGGEARPFATTPSTPVSVNPSRLSARVTPDGRHMAFTSTASPTGYDNTDVDSGMRNVEVFHYEAGAAGGGGRLLCISCNPSGSRPAGRLVNAGIAGPADDIWAAAAIPGWNSEYQPSRALSDNGGRVFFDSYDSLTPGDVNGRADVYQWEAAGEGSCTEISSSYSDQNGGCIRLISSGQSAADAEFLDASPNGSDVFFITAASLVPEDYGLRDVYDARVNGGFASSPSPGPGCQGEACQGPQSPPSSVTLPSNTFVGPGNKKDGKPPRRCPKGKHKVKRNGKAQCQSKKAKNKKGKHRANQSRGGVR